MSEDIVERAREAMSGIVPGPWWWGGNTDCFGDVELRGHLPGLGVVDVLRTCAEGLGEAAFGKEWDADSDLQFYIARDAYIEHRTHGEPRRYLSFGRSDGFFVEHGRDLAVYEVARKRGLPDDTPRDHPQVYRADVVGVRNPHARFIAAAPELVRELVAEVERLRSLVPADDQRKGACVDG